MKAGVSSSWEKKMAEKASRDQFLAQKKEAVEAARAKRKVRLHCTEYGINGRHHRLVQFKTTFYFTAASS
jgi:hypothetical protein